MDGPGHLLSLKVMRVSRPALANAWQPFYSSSPSFSAHSTTSIISLQGRAPLSGHPKTLRDLTHATELLTLPSSFGAIQLGETFSSCLCVNNEASVDIDSVTLKVEMQTVTSKVTLAEFGGSDFRLVTGDTLENIVNHEIKELGQHVLSCTVTYRIPPNMRHVPHPEDGKDSEIQTFRKFYKFAVTNPLSVKTKVHSPRSPSALLSATEREKIFLEVHIQNLTQEPMWFEGMRFECIDGWKAHDVNNEENVCLFSGSMAVMQPQDMRQYVYILSPKAIPSFPVTHTPGSIIPLGRLDISWRSCFGEPGRLLTSILSRRILLSQLPLQNPASALPLYLQKTSSTTSGTPSRPRSPQLVQSRPGTPPVPPQRPASPRIRTPAAPGRPQSPTIANPTVPLLLPTSDTAPSSHVEVDIVMLHILRNSIFVEKPFTVSFRLMVSLHFTATQRQNDRVISLAVQHTQPPPLNDIVDAFSSRQRSSGNSTPSPTGTPLRGAIFNFSSGQEKLLAKHEHETDPISSYPGQNGDIVLPPPYAATNSKVTSDVVSIGPSAIVLPPIRLSEAVKPQTLSNTDDNVATTEAMQEFEFTFLPLRKGFVTMGGLRVLLIEDMDDGMTDHKTGKGVETLREWDSFGEIWVGT